MLELTSSSAASVNMYFINKRANIDVIHTDEDRGCEDGIARLQGGTDDSNGHVEFCMDRGWGKVCEDDWDINAAIVLCRQLNFSSEGIHNNNMITVLLHE